MFELVRLESLFVKIDLKLVNRDDLEEEELVLDCVESVPVVSCGDDFDLKSVLNCSKYEL
jgi:hypothetical protein